MISPLELAHILEGWAHDARSEAADALDHDEIGKAARLRGKAEGLTLAAVELRRSVDYGSIQPSRVRGLTVTDWATGAGQVLP